MLSVKREQELNFHRLSTWFDQALNLARPHIVSIHSTVVLGKLFTAYTARVSGTTIQAALNHIAMAQNYSGSYPLTFE